MFARKANVKIREELAPYLDARSRRLIAVLAVFSGLGGVLEAGALAIMSAAVIGATRDEREISLLSLSLSFRTALVVGALLLVGRLAFAWFGARVNALLVDHVYRRAVDRLLDGYLNASWAVISDERLGNLQGLIAGNAHRVSSVALTLGQAITNVLNVAAMLAISTVMNPLAVVGLAVTGVLLFFSFRPLGRISRRYAAQISLESRTFGTRVTEISRLIGEVRTLNVGQAVANEVRNRNAAIGELTRRSRVIGLFAPPLYQTTVFAMALAFAGVLAVVDRGRTPALAATVLLLLRSMTFLNSLQLNYQSLLENGAFLRDLTAQIATYEQSREVSGTEPLGRIDAVECKGVGFGYDDRFAVHDIDVHIARGTSLGIVGPSGGGKSTLLQLLLGLRPATTGAVLLNGQPLQTYRSGDVRSRISFVPQSSELLAGTIADNVRFWRAIDDAALLAACRRAHLGDDIDKWPLGLDTEVGEAGGSLSGGQRQRVCIARALAGNPDVLVLDEPTSALDAHSEVAIHDMLEELKGDVTVIVVAHRPGTIRACDQLLVLRDGEVEDLGTVAELSRTNPFVMSMIAGQGGDRR